MVISVATQCLINEQPGKEETCFHWQQNLNSTKRKTTLKSFSGSKQWFIKISCYKSLAFGSVDGFGEKISNQITWNPWHISDEERILNHPKQWGYTSVGILNEINPIWFFIQTKGVDLGCGYQPKSLLPNAI